MQGFLEGTFYLVDDNASGVGGTSLTLDAIIEPNKSNVKLISTEDFSLKDCFSNVDMFIFGNLTNLTQNSLDAIKFTIENKPFVKIEFDYGYCKNRGRIPHEILSKEKCNCSKENTSVPHLKELYSLILKESLHIFYMSEGQRSIHRDDLLFTNIKKTSVLSSCFCQAHLKKFKELKLKEKNEKYAIIDGNGGWHTQAKGVHKSIKYAEKNKIPFDLIKTNSYDDMIELLSNYKGLITMPIIHDTCPRITIEARYMGLEVITNEKSQHITEDWWKKTDEIAYKFTKSRPFYFWEKLKCLKY